MIRRALFLLTVAGIYILVKRSVNAVADVTTESRADSQWANEGGANSPSTV